ncbi:unnamed protein product [Mesocestoides corti]|uniref:C2H2-type domain-containing protein n=1 Tax=Mesocestoides corti TaxID=53468 RepID=A0A0R3UHB8_MESCO|nr:unnamed protein product [Mesocestoides corti]
MDCGSDTQLALNIQIEELENAELRSRVLNSSQYLELLCLYLRSDDIMGARFLWKRISPDIKASQPYLKSVWDLAVLLLKHQHPQFLTVCQGVMGAADLPSFARVHLSEVYQRIQRSTLDLIRSAYSCISVADVCELLRLPEGDAISLMQGWTLSSDGLYLTEPSVTDKPAHSVDNNLLNSELMAKLTEFMSIQILKSESPLVIVIPHRQCFPACVRLRLAAALDQGTPPNNTGGCWLDSLLPLLCPQCPFHARNPVSLRRHAWSNHLDSDQIFQSRFYSCSKCTATTTDLNCLRAHYSRVHGLHSSDVKVLVNWITLTRDTIAHHATPPASAFTEVDDATPPVKEAGLQEAEGPVLSPSSPSPSPSSPSPPRTAAPAPSPPRQQPRPPSHDWSQLISRVDKKFSCLLCTTATATPSLYQYNGRTEVVFHVVTRHLLRKEIEDDLSQYGRLTTQVKHQIGGYFADGMHIRSGVHYKDAERVEAALFLSVELHLRWKVAPGANATTPPQKQFTCSGCQAIFHNEQVAVTHVNHELRNQLPEFMRARSCPWSLSTRDEWVWCVPDLVPSNKPSPPTASPVPSRPSHHGGDRFPGSSGFAPSCDPFSAAALSMEGVTSKTILFANTSSNDTPSSRRI